MIPGSIFDRPDHAAVVDRTQYCAQTVRFSKDRGPYCWAHGEHNLSPQSECMSANHGCNAPGVGRLGLCARHQKEIVG